ncbi:hypothetical protein DSL92_00860 [Billgrantia gudaonensis]|uniref:Large ribosomal subunit protein uL2 RNA-binding domain-containing protein n=1 Tax=Billgrantia gudaonensis TaxID=376427 RepID=A0A3S0NXH1_9GAMM|nr:hypothetical protein DSL92_00860 [Halomonas gudaonensis]
MTSCTRASPMRRCSRSLQSRSGGRNNNGRITIRHGRWASTALPGHRFQAHQGWRSGHRRAPEYDPNRSAHIALLRYLDGESPLPSRPRA